MFDFLKNNYGVSDKILSLMREAESECAPYIKRVEEISQYNALKVLNSFEKHKVSEQHLGITRVTATTTSAEIPLMKSMPMFSVRRTQSSATALQTAQQP